MTAKYTLDQIREFWKQQALEHGQSPVASWSDQPVIDMEIQEITRRLNDGDRVIDIGCANGYSTIQFAAQKCLKIRGVDYIPEMIEQACLRLNALKNSLVGTVEFDVDDITNLREPTATYDKVVVIRVIINLGEWNDQLKGLKESARVLRPGGILLFSEATIQGWQRMNRFRREWELDEIPMPLFNNYLDETQVIQSMSPELELMEIVNFASTYFVGTRVLKPLLIKALSSNVNVVDPNMEWNRWFSQLPAWGDYGTQKLFVFKKK